MNEAVLAIDLGTSSTKVLVVDRGEAVMARLRLPHLTDRPSPDAAEQDPEGWWTGLAAGLRDLPAGIRIAAIGITGQMHGLVIQDERGRFPRPAITWEDRRSTTTLPGLLAALPEEHPAIAPGYQAASWYWLTRRESETAARSAHLLLPKDAIVHRLTGRRVTDPSDAIGTGWYCPESGDWDVATVRAAGASVGMLPGIVPAGSIAGPLTREAAGALGLDAGIPVVVAGGDAPVAAFGAGATDPATPLVMLSTGCQALQPCQAMADSAAWPSASPSGLPRWLRVATTLNGGNVVRWARETFGEPALDTDIELTFLPYLAGERSPVLDPGAAGAFVGLRPRHGRPALARSALDGVALALADAFARAGGEIGGDSPVLAGGGGTRDDAWLASLANTLARPIHAIAEPDLSAWGAARSTATAIGWIDPVADSGAWRPATRAIAPGMSRQDAAGRLTAFRSLAARLFAAGGA